MKDIIITAKQARKELLILLACFAIAFIINISSIIAFKTSWHEMFTQIGYVLLITLAFYVIFGILRLLISGIKKLSKIGDLIVWK